MTTFDIAKLLNENGYHAEATDTEIWVAKPFKREAHIFSAYRYCAIEELYIVLIFEYDFRLPHLDEIGKYALNRMGEIREEEAAALTRVEGVTDPLFSGLINVDEIKAGYKKQLDKWIGYYTVLTARED